MKTIITYTVNNEYGYRRTYSNEVESYGYHTQLVEAIENAIELFELRQEAFRKRYNIKLEQE